jgi:C-terminal processing protease CtpA/Prc
MESMKPMMEEIKTSMMAQAEAMKTALPADMFEKMSTAMERTASGIGSQLMEQKNMTKVTKNLGNMGNVFSRGGLNI